MPGTRYSLIMTTAMRFLPRLSAACGLSLAVGIAGVADAATNLWWDTAYERRFNVRVSTGANVPDKGYAGYTARVAALDTGALISAGDLQADCSDLRVLYYDGIAWQELPRHVIGCNSAATDIRFMLAADIAASSVDDNYYVYYGNAAAGAAPAVTETNVYLWFDDASVDRSASYLRGRVDNWHGSGWDDSLNWNAAGYYSYDTGNNSTSGYRRAVDERDVYVEAEWFHTGCYTLNITTGVILRGIIDGGSGGSESTNHYYASNRAEYPGCQPSGYNHDGEIMTRNRAVTAVVASNPPDIAASVWRRQGLAAWLSVPTNLAFWDADDASSWAAIGYPSAGNLRVAGTHTNSESTGRGFAGIMTSQDIARVRNILVRRYVEPEPVLTLIAETQPPNLVVQKTVLTVFDPVNGQTNPKAIPGSHVDFTISMQNSGAGDVDSNTLVVTDPVPANASLFVGDLGGTPSGPVDFVDGGGAGTSGLSLDYGGPGDGSDDIEFSVDGSDWSYVPVADADGFDPAVRFIRVSPSGSFQGTTTATPTSFGLRMRVRID